VNAAEAILRPGDDASAAIRVRGDARRAEMTRGELRRGVRQAAAALARLGVQDEQRVLVALPDGQSVLPSQLLREFPSGGHAGEAAPENDDALAHLEPRMPPIQTGSVSAFARGLEAVEDQLQSVRKLVAVVVAGLHDMFTEELHEVWVLVDRKRFEHALCDVSSLL